MAAGRHAGRVGGEVPRSAIDVGLTPLRYVQQTGAIGRLPESLDGAGSVLAVADDLVWELVGEPVRAALAPAGAVVARWPFPGESSPRAADDLAAAARRLPATAIVGLGGGRAIDLAKVGARRAGCPLVTVPTSAATCAAASNVSVLYQDGRYVGTEAAATPVACLVDPSIVGGAPPRFLAAGMADALAKWEEGSAVTDVEAGDGALRLAARVAGEAHTSILLRGLEAHAETCAGRVTPAVERMVETNLLTTGLASCLGGARFRAAAAHAVYYGLTMLGRPFAGLHGEVVGFGLVVQALLLGRRDHAERLGRFLGGLEVPLTLAALGAPAGGADMEAFLDGILRPASSIHCLRRRITRDALRAALLDADAMGRSL